MAQGKSVLMGLMAVAATAAIAVGGVLLFDTTTISFDRSSGGLTTFSRVSCGRVYDSRHELEVSFIASDELDDTKGDEKSSASQACADEERSRKTAGWALAGLGLGGVTAVAVALGRARRAAAEPAAFRLR